MIKIITSQSKVFTWALHPNELYAYGLESGIPHDLLLADTGLSDKDIENLDLHINWLQYREMSNSLDTHANPDWSFQFGKRLSIGSHGLISLLALNCVNWEQAIDVLCNYSVLINPLFRTSRRDTPSHVYLSVTPEFSRDHIVEKHIEGLFSSLYQSIHQMGHIQKSEISRGVSVFLKAPQPDYAQTLEDFFNSTLSWGHFANQIRIDKRLLKRKIPNANPVSANQTRKILQAQLSQLPAHSGLLYELRSLFEQRIYSLEVCAERLFTSQPTLKRHLKNSGTSFSKELSIYRIEESCWAAIHTTKNVSELAEELGFQDINSFGRLFKKETGVPFSQYRELYQKTPLTKKKLRARA